MNSPPAPSLLRKEGVFKENSRFEWACAPVSHFEGGQGDVKTKIHN